jgi:hypothetical protein
MAILNVSLILQQYHVFSSYFQGQNSQCIEKGTYTVNVYSTWDI